MSVSAVASLRPIKGRCLQRATSGLLSVHIASRSSSFRLQAVVTLPLSSQRYQSTGKGDATPKNSQQPTQQPKQQMMTLRQFAGRALGAGLNNLAFALSPKGIKKAYRESPGSTSFAVILYVETGTELSPWGC